MSKSKNPSLMPRIGSRAHRVIVELARHSHPVKEDQLMAAHGLDSVEPTIWRQGPYRLLTASCLIEKVGQDSWALTQLGRKLMDEVEDSIVNAARLAAAVEERGVVPPRTPKPFTALTARPAARPIREGAYDYRDIPSLHSTLAKAGGE